MHLSIYSNLLSLRKPDTPKNLRCTSFAMNGNIQLISYTRYLETHSMETIYPSLCAQVAVGTFLMKSPVPSCATFKINYLLIRSQEGMQLFMAKVLHVREEKAKHTLFIITGFNTYMTVVVQTEKNSLYIVFIWLMCQWSQ